MGDYSVLLATLIALLAGLGIGKAWERYKLRDGRVVDRRRLRESPHYLHGLNFLIAGQIDHAIEEFTKASATARDAFELPILLGNLHREKGQVGRAIQIHQQLLQRPRLARFEQCAVLLCLGLDYKQGGFVDRAVEAFTEVLRIDPENQQALLNLEKLHEDQQQWQAAYEARERLMKAGDEASKPRLRRVLGFLEQQLGVAALARLDYDEAAKRFQAAIELDPAVVPAYLGLGDVRFLLGNASAAAAAWERIIDVAPDRAYLAFDRLAPVYERLGPPGRFADLCRRLIAASPQDWRARHALARHVAAEGRPAEALSLLLEAISVNPHALMLHQTVWQTLSAMQFPAAAVAHYVDVSREAVFYQDPHVCLRCRYRSTELLWQCPHCHEWNSFVEDRMTPARDEETADGVLAPAES
jgi:lipopolysaccharide biosynthesis regulator YciM